MTGIEVAVVRVVAPQARQDLVGRAFRFAVAVMDMRRSVDIADADVAYMAHQLFRSAASIGANLEEGQVASSRRDMASKYAIALRESREAHY